MDLSLLGFSGLGNVFNIHPVFVHFPIALFPVALFFYGFGTILKKENLFFAGRWCLYLAVVSSLLAVLTGLKAEASIPHNNTIHEIMQVHKKVGYAILLICVGLSGWSFWHQNHKPRMVWGFLSVLAVTVFLVLQNGDLGGRMVFVEGAGVKPAVSVINEQTEEPNSIQGEPVKSERNQKPHDHSGHQH